MKKIYNDRFLYKVNKELLLVRFSVQNGNTVIDSIQRIRNLEVYKQYLATTTAEIQTLLFANKVLKKLRDEPKGLVLFGMTGIWPENDKKELVNSSAFFRFTEVKDPDIHALSTAVIKLSAMLEKCPQIEDIYWAQEHDIQNILDDFAIRTLTFSPEKVAVALSELTQIQNGIVKQYYACTGSNYLTLRRPILGEMRAVPELKDSGVLTYDNYCYCNSASAKKETLFHYITSFLEIMGRTSVICKDLHWLYTDRKDLVDWINKIVSNGYTLKSEMCLNYSASTGRIFTKQEHLQDIPKKLRHLIAVPDGFNLISFDYSNHEPGIYAALGGGQMWEAMNSPDIDPYTLVGNATAEMTGVDMLDVRAAGKIIVNAFANGITWRGIQEHFGIESEKAEAIIASVQAMFPDTIKSVNELKNKWYDGEKLEYSVNGLRVFRYFGKLLNPDDRYASEFRNRKVMSGFIQGYSTLILKSVLLKLPELLQQFDLQLLYPIHDSLLLLVPNQCHYEASIAIQQLMDETLFESVGQKCDRMRSKIEVDWMKKRTWK